MSPEKLRRLQKDIAESPDRSTWIVRSSDEGKLVSEMLASVGKAPGKISLRRANSRIFCYPPRGVVPPPPAAPRQPPAEKPEVEIVLL